MDWFGTGSEEKKESVLTVYEISSTISRLLDDYSLKGVWVEGEVTNFHRHTSGHLYFSLLELKNKKTYLINCAMWRSCAIELEFSPKNGSSVRVYGSVEVYEPHGKFQFIVRDIIPCGEGDKHILVARWKEELSLLGYFDESRKKPLPKYPAKIGVVTASGGAAIKDIENVIQRRYPVEIIISPTSVQGETAHLQIAQALKKIDGRVDVIIIGRGGGSFEDLFAFNHPDVVTAVAECKTPVVSAVGHEIDYSLCDFAADVRAPTPSAAAEIVVPDRNELYREIRVFKKMLTGTLENRLYIESHNLENLRLHISRGKFEKLVNTQYERLDNLSARLSKGIYMRLEKEKMNLDAIRSKLDFSDPTMPLKRGFCMIKSGDSLIKTASELKKGQNVTLHMSDGYADADIMEVYNGKKL